MTVALILIVLAAFFFSLHTSGGRLYLPAFCFRGERWRIRAGRSQVRWLLNHKVENYPQGRVHLILVGPILILVMIDPEREDVRKAIAGLE